MYIYQGNSRELKGTQGNSRELKGTQGSSKEALVEVMEGKKLRKRGKEVKFHKSENEKRENIEALYERLKTPCGYMENEKKSFHKKSKYSLKCGHLSNAWKICAEKALILPISCSKCAAGLIKKEFLLLPL